MIYFHTMVYGRSWKGTFSFQSRKHKWLLCSMGADTAVCIETGSVHPAFGSILSCSHPAASLTPEGVSGQSHASFLDTFSGYSDLENVPIGQDEKEKEDFTLMKRIFSPTRYRPWESRSTQNLAGHLQGGSSEILFTWNRVAHSVSPIKPYVIILQAFKHGHTSFRLVLYQKRCGHRTVVVWTGMDSIDSCVWTWVHREWHN